MSWMPPAFKQRPIVAAALAALVLVVSACGGAAPTPAPPQELRLNLGAEPSSLDPQTASTQVEFSVIRQVFQGLLGFKADLSLEPVVAVQIPTVQNGGISQDGLAYTFKLRDNVAWSDDQHLAAADFAFAIKRLLDPETAARSASLYGAVKGAMQYNSARGAGAASRQALRDALGVEAPDPATLRVTLARPDPTFLHKMALAHVFPVRQDVIERLGARWTEAGSYVGNGPFVMTEWVHQDHITLKANQAYWGPKPKLEKITLSMLGDPNAELAAYKNNEMEFSRVPPGTERAILADPALGQQVVRVRDLFAVALFFNNAAPPFNSLKVRQAFTTAIDRAAWIDQVNNGVGKAATGWLPPEMPGYDPGLGSEYAFDRDKARRLLAEAGFPGGAGFPQVTFTYGAFGGERIIAEFIQAQIKSNLGVELTLEPLDPPAFFQRVLGARQFQMTSVGWGGGYPDPEYFLAPLFITGSGQNIIGYSNRDFDRLAMAASAELDQAKRLQAWKDAHAVLVKDAPIAFFFHQERFFLKKPAVRGLTLTGIDGAFPGDTRLAEVFIAG